MNSLKLGQQSLLGYLPALVIKNIIYKKIDIQNNEFPQHYTFKTVALFADISGFTKLSEAFSKKGRSGPEFLAFSINRYMEQLVGIIGKNGGDVFKFAGDALLVIWPETQEKDLSKACRRAVQCALDIRSKLHNVYITKNVKLSIKVGIGVGDIRILVVGGQFNRCEYLCIGDAMAQACYSEGKAEKGGEVVCSDNVFNLMSEYISAVKIESNDLKNAKDEDESSKLDFYLINDLDCERVAIKADAYLMRTKFSSDQVRENIPFLKTFVPNAIVPYLTAEKEAWCKEIRILSVLFMSLNFGLNDTKTEEGLIKIQKTIKSVQRSIYSTRGSLNKFLLDDKGSTVLASWGLPPGSNPDDHTRAVFGCLKISLELEKLNVNAYMGVTTGTCFSGVCGNIGNRREYSLLGDIVNLSARYMGMSKKYGLKNKLKYVIFIDEFTKELIQDKILVEYVMSDNLKGFTNKFDFYIPKEVPNTQIVTNPFPKIRTHKNNCILKHEISYNSSLDANKALNRSMFMVGREDELSDIKQVLDSVYLNKTNNIVVIKGVIGSGKSLFIRKCLYKYFYNDNKLNLHFKGINNYPIIFIEYQKPGSLFVPLNGLNNIFSVIINKLGSLMLKEKDKKIITITLIEKQINIEVDFIGELLFKLIDDEYCYVYLNYIKEICDYDFNNHFKICKNSDTLYLQKAFDLSQRDELFELRKYTKKAITHIVNFIVEIIVLYKIHCIDCTNIDLPLVFVIEDCHIIDELSCEVIYNLSINKSLKSFISICSYRTSISNLINNHYTDFFCKYDDDYQYHTIYMRPLIEYNDVFALIKETLKNKYNYKIEKVEKKLINIIISKAFNGIPMFIATLVENMAFENKFAQFAGNELILTYELEIMEKTLDWSDFTLPTIIEKLVGSIIDTLSFKEIILLKIACVIGTIFDIDKLDQFNEFNNITIDELTSIIYNLEKKGILEILYDTNPRYLVCKFCIPFMKEVLYQRMLLEQKADLHLNVARAMQESSFTYRESSIELRLLKMNLSKSERTISSVIDENNVESNNDISNNNNSNINEIKKFNSLSLTNLKTYYFKEMCDKITNTNNNNNSIDPDSKIIKKGDLGKKSDKGITWEDRFCIITKNKFMYWYYEKNFKHKKLPLGQFLVKNITAVNLIGDYNNYGKKNVVYITVNQWNKKDLIKPARGFFFSAESKEDLMFWITALNFLCLNAFYESFTKNFGVIQFPLNNFKKPLERKHKKKFNYTDVSTNNYNCLTNHMSNSINTKRSMNHTPFLNNNNNKNNSISDKHSLNKEKNIISNSINISNNKKTNLEDEKKYNENLNYFKNEISNFFHFSLALFFGYIQEKVFTPTEQCFSVSFKVPEYMQSKLSNIENKLSNYDTVAVNSINNYNRNSFLSKSQNSNVLIPSTKTMNFLSYNNNYVYNNNNNNSRFNNNKLVMSNNISNLNLNSETPISNKSKLNKDEYDNFNEISIKTPNINKYIKTPNYNLFQEKKISKYNISDIDKNININNENRSNKDKVKSIKHNNLDNDNKDAKINLNESFINNNNNNNNNHKYIDYNNLNNQIASILLENKKTICNDYNVKESIKDNQLINNNIIENISNTNNNNNSMLNPNFTLNENYSNNNNKVINFNNNNRIFKDNYTLSNKLNQINLKDNSSNKTLSSFSDHNNSFKNDFNKLIENSKNKINNTKDVNTSYSSLIKSNLSTTSDKITKLNKVSLNNRNSKRNVYNKFIGNNIRSNNLNRIMELKNKNNKKNKYNNNNNNNMSNYNFFINNGFNISNFNNLNEDNFNSYNVKALKSKIFNDVIDKHFN